MDVGKEGIGTMERDEGDKDEDERDFGEMYGGKG